MKRIFIISLLLCVSIYTYSQCQLNLISHTDNICPGYCDGSATVEATGTGSINVEWVESYQFGLTATGLCTGDHTVIMYDQASCSTSIVVTITEPPMPSITTTVVDESCYGMCDGSITVSVIGTHSPYTFSWGGGGKPASVSSQQNLCGGTYFNILITDHLGCEFYTYGEIMPAPMITLDLYPYESDCSGNGYIDAVPNIGGGQAKPMLFSFLWSNGDTTSTNDSLMPGYYSVTVTAGPGCTASDSAYVPLTEGNYPQLNIDTYQFVNCLAPNKDNGYVTIGAQGLAPFNFIWSNGVNGESLDSIGNLIPGFYTVTVTDSDAGSNSCANVIGFEIIDNSISIEVLGYGTNCPNYTDGYAWCNVITGEPPYTYLWDADSQTSYDIYSLDIGVYSVTATDNVGCTATGSFAVYPNGGFGTSIDTIARVCYGESNGALRVNINSGYPPYNYYWSSGDTYYSVAESYSEVYNLSPGIYSVTVTDSSPFSYTCNVGFSYAELKEPAEITYSVNQTDLTCYNINTGEISIVASGGWGGVTYSWSHDGGLSLPVASGLYAGDYYFSITDIESCYVEDGVTLYEPPQITNTVSKTDLTCFNDGTGEISLATTGGTGSIYVYAWSHNGGLTGPVATALEAGDYSYTVSDTTGCAVSETVTVTQPDQLVLDSLIISQSCYGLDTSRVIILAHGGVMPYLYSLDSTIWQGELLFENLTPGQYYGHINDFNNCYLSAGSILINYYDEVLVTVDVTPVECGIPLSGQAEAIVIQGTQPVTFNWTNGSLTQIIDSLSGGTYAVTVTDPYGCVGNASGDVLELAGWELSGIVQSSAGPLNVNESEIKLYKSRLDVFQIEMVQIAFNGSSGVFSITGQETGDYRLLVVPDTAANPLFLNTWYSNVISWEDAVALTVQCEDTISNLVLDVLELPVLTGNGSFCGFIHFWDNVKGYYEVGEPVEGAEVFIEQQPNDEPVSNVSSNVDGYWEANNLQENYSYDIHVEVPGLPVLSTYSNIPVSASQSIYENLNFYIDTTENIGGIFIDTLVSYDLSGIECATVEVFPNPVKDILNVRFNSEKELVYSWELFDVKGRLVNISESELKSTGCYIIQIPILEKGTYYLMIRADKNNFIKKIVKE